MKKSLVTLILISFFAGTALAGTLRLKDYDTGLGIKIGMVPGLTAKHFFNASAAVEGVLTYRWSGLNLTGLAEFHLPVFDTEGMYFYYGGGLHVGVWDSAKAKDQPATGRKLNFGIDGIVGLEYDFRDVPLSLGLDWKPNFNIITDSWLIVDEISLVLRYLIR
jgi:hypothetical protein